MEGQEIWEGWVGQSVGDIGWVRGARRQWGATRGQQWGRVGQGVWTDAKLWQGLS